MPGVASAIASVGFPLWGGMRAGLAIEDEAPGTPRREVAYFSVSPDFIVDVDARLVAGRALLSADTRVAPRSVVINETMARTFWPNGDAIGAEVQIGPGRRTSLDHDRRRYRRHPPSWSDRADSTDGPSA